MKLLFYLTRFPAYGGIETVTNIVGAYLITNYNYKIDILTHIKSDRDLKICNYSSIFNMPNSQKWNAEDNIQFAEQVIKSGNYDALIYQDSYAPTETIVCGLSVKFSIPLYVFQHSSVYWFKNSQTASKRTSLIDWIKLKKRFWVNRKRTLFLLSNCHRFVLLSKRYEDDLYRLVGNDKLANKVRWINNPIEYSPIPKEQIKFKENIILTVCQLTKNKNVALMLRMWKEISTTLQGWKFIIVGDGPEMNSLKIMAKEFNIEGVIFVGFSEPTQYYEKSKIFWMTSGFEGWGLTLIEAMQKGCVPIGMNSFNTLSEIVSTGVNGYCITTGDVESFMDKTKEIALDPHKYIEMADAAVSNAERFDVGKICEQWVSLLEEK